MAIYVGRRDGRCVSVTADGEPLPPRNDLINHSPDGFEWGYLGSGPSQLALALLAHHFRNTGDSQELADAKALALYHEVKLELITTLSESSWQFDSHVVADTVQMVIKEGAERYFALAMENELFSRQLSRELSVLYTLLEQTASEQG